MFVKKATPISIHVNDMKCVPQIRLESIYLYFPPSSQLFYFSVTEVTSTPTKPVDNVVIATKGLQDRKI